MMTCQQLFDAFQAKYEELLAKYPRIGPFEGGRLATCGGNASYDFRETSAQLLLNASGQRLEVHGGIYDRWMTEGGGYGALGLPITDEEEYLGADAEPGDRVSAFENGRIIWRAETAETEVRLHGEGVSMVNVGRQTENRKDIGLVLSGGGAKGAFQAGVWQAMCELGLAERVKVISGTSIGAINGAAFAARGDPGALCGFWRRHAGEIASPNLRALGPKAFLRGVRNVLAGKAFPFQGLMDRSALERLIGTVLPQSWPGEAPEVIATALECKGGIFSELDSSRYRLRRFRVDRTEDAQRRTRMLLASAAIPWGFDAVEIDGKRYVDGGWDHAGGDNVPVEPVVSGGYPGLRTVIVVRCNSAAVEPAPLRACIPRGVRVVEVRPSKTLPGIFDGVLDLLENLPATDALTRQLRILSGSLAFDAGCAARSLRQGYMDGLAALRPLRRVKLEW